MKDIKINKIQFVVVFSYAHNYERIKLEGTHTNTQTSKLL